MAKAAMVLGVSERQSFRIKARIRKEGVRGVIHGNRGRSSPRKLSPTTHQRIVALARGKYRGFNDHHLTEKLTDPEGIRVSRETVRQILRAAGFASPRKRRPPRHRARRQRRAAAGMLLQVDGSHDWLEGRGPTLTLVGAIDDATGQVPGACFAEHETTWAYLSLFLHVFTKQGLPQAIYADRHSIFWTDREPTVAEQLAGQRPRTQVGRALDELGITLIPAGSPQAKGRVERLWGTFQDRLVSELRLAGATTRTEAQAVLARFLPSYNRRFAKPAAAATPAGRGVDRPRLTHRLCFTYRRVVAKDNTVAFHGAVLPLPKRSPFVSWARKAVDVLVLLDGSVEIFAHHDRIARFDAKTARTSGLHRTNGRREVSRYGPDTTTAAQRYAMAP